MLKDLKFQYKGAQVQYDATNDCAERGCDDEGICRCGGIENEFVSAVDVSKMSDCIYDSYFEGWKNARRNNTINNILYGIGKEIDVYCIDRILRAHKIWMPEKWSIEVMHGYYGQEIGDVSIRNECASLIEADIEKAISLGSLKEKVGFLLCLENGRLLPELEGKVYEIKTIEIDEVEFGNKEHAKRASSKNHAFYSDANYSGIRGVVMESGGKLRAIDGYHRLSSTKRKTAKVIAITAYKLPA